MSLKYEAFDQKLFNWLSNNRTNVTTALASQALGASSTTLQRHISRRFSQLEDRGVLECRLEGTTRVCSVIKELPATLAKKRWRPAPRPDTSPSPGKSIPAQDSLEFEAGGGNVERLPTYWDRRPSCNAIGLVSIDHVLAALD